MWKDRQANPESKQKTRCFLRIQNCFWEIAQWSGPWFSVPGIRTMQIFLATLEAFGVHNIRVFSRRSEDSSFNWKLHIYCQLNSVKVGSGLFDQQDRNTFRLWELLFVPWVCVQDFCVSLLRLQRTPMGRANTIKTQWSVIKGDTQTDFQLRASSL